MRLAHNDSGPGKPVVLLHGFPLDRSMWYEQVRGLPTDYRLITPDLRGQGESLAEPGVHTMEDMADDVFETLDQIGVTEPVVLGGLSMGGYVALAAAAKYAHRLRGLILLDTRAVADTPEAAANRETNARKLEETGDIVALVDAMIPRLFGSTTRERNPSLIATVRASMLDNAAAGLAGALRGMAVRPDREAMLGSIEIPTLVVVGDEDVISTPSESATIAAAIPGAGLVVIPEAGHLAPLENPSAVNSAISSFLAGLG